MSKPRILVAGIGNIFLGDDAFGVEVAQRLIGRELPREVRTVDFGIRGMDLTYALMDGYDAAILVDATARGGEPGTLYVIEPEMEEEIEPFPDLGEMVDMHSLDPAKVLGLVRFWGSEIKHVLVVGCEPRPVGDGELEPMGLSEPVRAAVDEAVRLVEELVGKLIEEADADRSHQAATGGK
jgi:hydrogenase maturation protease